MSPLDLLRTALSRPHNNEYIVLDQHDRQHRVSAETEEAAKTKVINSNILGISARRCRVVKVK
jgi:hypothetical protein